MAKHTCDVCGKDAPRSFHIVVTEEYTTTGALPTIRMDAYVCSIKCLRKMAERFGG